MNWEEECRSQCVEVRELRAEIERLQAYKRAQAEDIITLGQQVGKLEAENERLRAALHEIARMGKDGYDARDLGREARKALEMSEQAEAVRKRPIVQARTLAFNILTKHSGCFVDDEPLDDLLEDIAQAILGARLKALEGK